MLDTFEIRLSDYLKITGNKLPPAKYKIVTEHIKGTHITGIANKFSTYKYEDRDGEINELNGIEINSFNDTLIVPIYACKVSLPLTLLETILI